MISIIKRVQKHKKVIIAQANNLFLNISNLYENGEKYLFFRCSNDFLNYMLKYKHMESFVKYPTIDLIFLR